MYETGDTEKPEETDSITHTAEKRTQVAVRENGPKELAGASNHLGWQTHNSGGQIAICQYACRAGESEVMVAPPASSVNAIGIGQGQAGHQGQERSGIPRGRFTSSSGYESEAPQQEPVSYTHLTLPTNREV